MARGVHGSIDLTVPGGGCSGVESIDSVECGTDNVSADGSMKRILEE